MLRKNIKETNIIDNGRLKINKIRSRKIELTVTASNSGDCKALDKNSEMLPSFKLFICRQRDCRGVLKISGN